jgi:hypothetical protein
MVEESPTLPLLKRRKKALMIVSVALAIVIILGVSISNLNLLNKTENSPPITVSKPKVVINSTNFRMDPIDEHLAYVDVGLHNDGGAGTVGVHVTLTDGVNDFRSNESIYFIADESRDFTFTFSEVSFSNLSDVHAYTWISILQTNSDK